MMPYTAVHVCALFFFAIFRLTAKYGTIIHAIIVELRAFTLCVNRWLILRIKTAIVYQKCVVCKLYIVHSSHSDLASKDNMRLACVNDVLAGNCYYYSSQPKHMYELYISYN